MPRFTHLHRAVLVACAAVALAGCAAPSATGSAGVSAASALAASSQVRQDSFNGVYEVVPHPAAGAVFVATAPSFDKAAPGFVHRLDARTLQVLQTVQTPRRAFALGLNEQTGTLYVGNTLDGSLSIVDLATSTVRGVLQLAEPQRNADGKESVAHTRKVVVDSRNDRVFVTSPGQKGKLWIIDGKQAKVLHTVDTGLYTAGLAYDADADRIYVGQGGQNEILVVNPANGAVEQRFATGDGTSDTPDGSKHFLINLALDTKGKRLFAVDSNTNQVYVFDTASGKIVRQVPVGGNGALDIVFNAQRNEFVTTHRGVSRAEPQGTGAVTVFDATTYAVKRVIPMPVHPNSLALSPNGQTLYVTVKAPRSDKHGSFRKDGNESVVRIDL